MKRYNLEYNVMYEHDDGDYVDYEEAQSIITSLQAQLAEAQETILEQQANVYKDAKIIRKHLETIDSYQRIAYQQRDGRLAALEKVASLESALKAERLAGKIEGPEEASENTCLWLDCRYELKRMATELKEGK